MKPIPFVPLSRSCPSRPRARHIATVFIWALALLSMAGSGWAEPAVGNILIQVGAFSRAEGAATLTTELQEKGYASVTVADGDYHRVVIGPFPNAKAASASLDMLLEQGYEGYIRGDLQIPPRKARAAIADPKTSASAVSPPRPPAVAPKTAPSTTVSIPAPAQPAESAPRASSLAHPESNQPAPRQPSDAPQPQVAQPVEYVPQVLPTTQLAPVRKPVIPVDSLPDVQPRRSGPELDQPLLLAVASPPAVPEPLPAAAITPSRAGLRILVLAGEGAINSIKQRSAQPPVVQVIDRDNEPVAGAVLVFTLPGHGASGTFANGNRTTIALTDRNGTGAAMGLRPNTAEGEMPILVTASHQGRTASTTIRQRNFRERGMRAAAKATIVSAIAAGVLVSVVKVLESNSASGVTDSISSTASVGTPSVGQP